MVNYANQGRNGLTLPRDTLSDPPIAEVAAKVAIDIMNVTGAFSTRRTNQENYSTIIIFHNLLLQTNLPNNDISLIFLLSFLSFFFSFDFDYYYFYYYFYYYIFFEFNKENCSTSEHYQWRNQDLQTNNNNNNNNNNNISSNASLI